MTEISQERLHYAAFRLSKLMLRRKMVTSDSVREIYRRWPERMEEVRVRACLPACYVKLARRIWGRGWTIENAPTPPGFW